MWNGNQGKVKYHGSGQSYKIENSTFNGRLHAGRNFSIGSSWSNDIGYLTQLNIWDYELAQANIFSMLSGGFNVHGNALSWSGLAAYIHAWNIRWKTQIYLPGKKNLILMLILALSHKN